MASDPSGFAKGWTGALSPAAVDDLPENSLNIVVWIWWCQCTVRIRRQFPRHLLMGDGYDRWTCNGSISNPGSRPIKRRQPHADIY